ncbi:MAG: histidine phosphatase family protein [Lachnospiraceae bacterium]|nr:histidine phosphatase family protein [Lachnospiraceae bacterium]
MTSIYLVRHAKPNHCWEDDRTRPLSEEGVADSEQVVKKLQDISFDYAVSSPYLRSVDTIKECAKNHNLEIHMDERLREREKGAEGNNFIMFRKRWGDFDYHEKGGESLRMVQDRNMEAIMELLEYHEGENILVGTHGTALSTILNYFNPTFLCDDFLRIIDFMPYIIRLDFNEKQCIGKEELLIIEKEYKGKH